MPSGSRCPTPNPYRYTNPTLTLTPTSPYVARGPTLMSSRRSREAICAEWESMRAMSCGTTSSHVSTEMLSTPEKRVRGVGGGKVNMYSVRSWCAIQLGDGLSTSAPDYN